MPSRSNHHQCFFIMRTEYPCMANICEIPMINASTEELLNILKTSKVIAVMGLSANPDKPSNQVAVFLKEHGYTIVPVNPAHDELLGEKCYPSLSDIPFDIDIADVFRRSEDIPPVADDAINKGVTVFWMQEGIVNNEAADKLRDAGITVVMDKCTKKEYIANI